MALALEYKDFCFAHAGAEDGAAEAEYAAAKASERAAADMAAAGVEGGAAGGSTARAVSAAVGAGSEANIVGAPVAAPVLNGVNWGIEQGEFAVLVGATGSGKTTLMRCAVPALRPAGTRSGEVLLAGTPIDQLSTAQAAAAVGYVAQNPDAQIVCDTVWHQLAFGLENLGVSQQEMRRIVAELSHFLGIAGWFRKKTSELSGGQRQLLNLASVLVMKPRVLLLDEPVSMLDPVAQKDFMHTLQRLNRELGLTVVVSTHSPLGFVPYATRFFELKKGAILPASCDDILAGRVGLGSLGKKGAAAVTECGVPVDNGEPVVRATVVAANGEQIVAANSASGGAKDTAIDGGQPSVPAHDNAKKSEPMGALGSKDARVASGPAVTLNDVYVRYNKGADFVLRGMDLRVQRGSIHAVIGGNGCGKSTLLRAIAGLMKPERGKLKNELSTRQALLPQDPKALFVRDSVLEELQEWQRACAYDDAAIACALQRCGLEERGALHPYDLSGGQQQLLALAKLTLTDPDLLLLDEPTKGLDPAARMHVAHELLRLRDEGRTVVLVTHDLAFASAVADEVSLLFDGQMACTQSAREFFDASVFYRPDRDAFLLAWECERRCGCGVGGELGSAGLERAVLDNSGPACGTGAGGDTADSSRDAAELALDQQQQESSRS